MNINYLSISEGYIECDTPFRVPGHISLNDKGEALTRSGRCVNCLCRVGKEEGRRYTDIFSNTTYIVHDDCMEYIKSGAESNKGSIFAPTDLVIVASDGFSISNCEFFVLNEIWRLPKWNARDYLYKFSDVPKTHDFRLMLGVAIDFWSTLLVRMFRTDFRNVRTIVIEDGFTVIKELPWLQALLEWRRGPLEELLEKGNSLERDIARWKLEDRVKVNNDIEVELSAEGYHTVEFSNLQSIVLRNTLTLDNLYDPYFRGKVGSHRSRSNKLSNPHCLKGV